MTTPFGLHGRRGERGSTGGSARYRRSRPRIELDPPLRLRVHFLHRLERRQELGPEVPWRLVLRSHRVSKMQPADLDRSVDPPQSVRQERVDSARVKIRILLISTELDMFSQAEDCKFWGPTLESVGLWGNLRSQRPGTPSFMSVEISVYSIPNFYNYIL